MTQALCVLDITCVLHAQVPWLLSTQTAHAIWIWTTCHSKSIRRGREDELQRQVAEWPTTSDSNTRGKARKQPSLRTAGIVCAPASCELCRLKLQRRAPKPSCSRHDQFHSLDFRELLVLKPPPSCRLSFQPQTLIQSSELAALSFQMLEPAANNCSFYSA